MGVELRAGASTDIGAGTQDARAGAMPAGAVEVRWVARSHREDPAANPVWPRMRRRKSTRCGHCAFCHPGGPGGGVRVCTQPGRAAIVVGDQFACGDFASPAPLAGVSA